MRNLAMTLPFALLLAALGCGAAQEEAEKPPADTAPAAQQPPAPAAEPVIVEMDVKERGKVVLELYPDKAPETVKQITKLIGDGFYEGQRVHRVEHWVVQWGDPNTAKPNWKELRPGTVGSGSQLPFESNDLIMAPGILAMASTGTRVGGDSQMFILTSNVLPEQCAFLQDGYAIFGKVKEGMDVVDKIQEGDVISMKIPGAEEATSTAPEQPKS